MTTIGFIGSGNVGRAIAQLAVNAGYSVLLSNSRGPASLNKVADSLGPFAVACTVDEVADRSDIVVVAVPLNQIGSIPEAPLRNKIVVDANNYYPERDGRIPELEDETATTSELLQRHLPGSWVVKSFNHIFAAELIGGVHPESGGRRAIVLSGDDFASKLKVAGIINDFGFDFYDVGPLSEGWRIQRDTPGYVAVLDRQGLRDAVSKARRYSEMDPEELTTGVPDARALHTEDRST